MTKIAVVVSGWVGHPHDTIARLLRSFEDHPAGAPHDLVLAANGLDFALPAELAGRFAAIFVRENRGYNIGAWDHAWRQLDHERFLFLQDECVAIRSGWLADFDATFTRSGGLVGEQLNRAWDRPWEELTGDWPDAHRARTYLATLERWGIVPGETARHLTTVVQYTSREVLEEVGGFPLGETYDEAIAAEIGFSRRVAATGRSLVQIGRRRHSRIAHPQWPKDDLFSRLSRSLKKRLG